MTISDLDVIEKNLKLSLEADIIEFNKQLDFYSDIDISMEEGYLSDKYRSVKDKVGTAVNVTVDAAKAVKKTAGVVADAAGAVWNSRLMGFIKESTKNNLYDVSEKIATTMSQLRKVKLDKLYRIQTDLSNEDIISNGKPISGKLKSMLAIYNELGYNTSYSDLEEYISLPRDIIMDSKVFQFISSEVAKKLITKKGLEDKITKKVLPLDFNNLIREEAPDYINEYTRVVIPSNLYGKTIFLMKVDQSFKKGTVIENKKLRVKETDIEFPPISNTELKSLVERAIKLGLDTAYIEYDHMKKYKIEIDTILKNNLGSVVLKSPLAIFNYRRLMSGLGRSIVGLKRSHLQSLDIVEYIARAGTKRF